MSAPITPDEFPLPPSPTLSSESSHLSSSTQTDDTELSIPPPLPTPTLSSLLTHNRLLLDRIKAQHASELAQIRSLTASMQAHKEAIDTRRHVCAQLTQQREQHKAAERLFVDARLNELVCKLLAVKNMAVVEDEGRFARRARELEQVGELRDVIAELWIWERTALQRRMKELSEEDMSVDHDGTGAEVQGSA